MIIEKFFTKLSLCHCSGNQQFFVVAESLHETKILVSLFSEDQQFLFFLQKNFFKKKAKEAAVNCSQEMSTKVEQHFAVVTKFEEFGSFEVVVPHTHTHTHTLPVNVKPNKRGK
jgi:hypothetical protein